MQELIKGKNQLLAGKMLTKELCSMIFFTSRRQFRKFLDTEAFWTVKVPYKLVTQRTPISSDIFLNDNTRPHPATLTKRKN